MTLFEIGALLLLACMSIGVLLTRTIIQEAVVDRLRNRKSKLLHLSSRIWKHSESDFELQFIFSNRSQKHTQLNELIAVRPKGALVAWLTTPMERHPNISHLESEEITNKHKVTLEVPSHEAKTVSMALRTPNASVDRVVIRAICYESGHPRPIKLNHKISLSSSLPVFRQNPLN